jgi:post-segregation antitoxin (ccd killing protein)
VPSDQAAVHPLRVMVRVEGDVLGLLKEFGEHGARRCARVRLRRRNGCRARFSAAGPLWTRGGVCILVCMARLNVYVPDELAERARAHGLNVSALTQAAIASELERASVSAWLDSLPPVSSRVGHDAVMAALDAARDDFGQ